MTTTALARVQQGADVLALLKGHEAEGAVAALVRQVADLRALNVRALGSNECFRLTKGGITQREINMVELSQRRGEIYTIGIRPEPNSKTGWARGSYDKWSAVDPLTVPWQPAADGYYTLKNAAGVQIITERESYDPPNMMPKLISVTCYKVAVGKDLLGNPQIVRGAFPYVPDLDFYETLKAKAKYDSNKEIRFGVKSDLMPGGKRPPHHIWVPRQTFGGEEIGYLCSLSNSKTRELFMDADTRNKNAPKKANTVGDRLLLRAFFGVSKVRVYRDGDGPDADVCAVVPVWGWTHDYDQILLKQIADAAGQGAELAEIFGGQRVQVIDAEITEEEVAEAAAEEGVANPEIEDEDVVGQVDASAAPAPEVKAEPDPEPDKPEPSSVEVTARKAMDDFVADHGEDDLISLLGNEGIDHAAVVEQGADQPTWIRIIKTVRQEMYDRRKS